jgi:hypothetical protein
MFGCPQNRVNFKPRPNSKDITGFPKESFIAKQALLRGEANRARRPQSQLIVAT